MFTAKSLWRENPQETFNKWPLVVRDSIHSLFSILFRDQFRNKTEGREAMIGIWLNLTSVCKDLINNGNLNLGPSDASNRKVRREPISGFHEFYVIHKQCECRQEMQFDVFSGK